MSGPHQEIQVACVQAQEAQTLSPPRILTPLFANVPQLPPPHLLSVREVNSPTRTRTGTVEYKASTTELHRFARGMLQKASFLLKPMFERLPGFVKNSP